MGEVIALDFFDLNTAPRYVTEIERGADFERRLDSLRGALKARAADLAREVFPAGFQQGDNWRVGDLTGARGESLAIAIRGDNAGQWIDHASNERGDLIDLWRETQGYLGDHGFTQAVEDLELHLGISPGFRSTGPVAKVATQRAQKAASEPKPQPPVQIDEKRHSYLDASGQEVARVVRKEFADGSKTFIQQRRAANGGWEYKSPEVRPIFRAYELASEATLVLVEGEKCAERLGEADIPAISLMGGANAKLDAITWGQIAGKRIILWPDADEPGRALMERVEPILRQHGCQTAWVQVPANAPKGWDAADMIKEGGSPVALLRPALEALQALPSPKPLPSPSFIPHRFDGVPPLPRAFVYDTFLMRKAVTAVAAPPGVGKTTFSMQLALAVAFDLELGDFKPAQGGGGNVLLYNAEEPLEEMDRRFMAACIEMGLEFAEAAERVHYISGQSDEPGFRPWRLAQEINAPTRSGDVDQIIAAVRAGGYSLLILDPLTDLHGVKEDTEGMRVVGQSLREISTSANASVLVFHHTPKSANGDTAAGDMGALRGGGGLAGAARFVLTMFTMTPAEGHALGVPPADIRDFVRIDRAKANMARAGVGGHYFRKLGQSLDNATAQRPADIVAVLRREALGSQRAAREEQKEAQAQSRAQALAEQVAEACQLLSATSPEAKQALDKVIKEALRKMKGLGATVAKELFVERIKDGHQVRVGKLRVIEQMRGVQTWRYLWVEVP